VSIGDSCIVRESSFLNSIDILLPFPRLRTVRESFPPPIRLKHPSRAFFFIICQFQFAIFPISFFPSKCGSFNTFISNHIFIKSSTLKYSCRVYVIDLLLARKTFGFLDNIFISDSLIISGSYQSSIFIQLYEKRTYRNRLFLLMSILQVPFYFETDEHDVNVTTSGVLLIVAGQGTEYAGQPTSDKGAAPVH